MIDLSRKQTRYVVISTVAMLVTALVIVQPIQLVKSDQGETIAEQGDESDPTITQISPGFPDVKQCTRKKIKDPTEMSTSEGFLGDNIPIKTVHVDKLIFKCETTQGSVPILVETTIYAEIFENLILLPMNPITNTNAEVVACAKLNDTAALVGCETYRPRQDVVITRNCVPERVDHPIEMNVLVSADADNNRLVAKTIEAEKEIFLCNDKSLIREVVLFTEVYEELGENVVIPPKRVVSFSCVVKVATGEVISCLFDQGIIKEIPAP